jgi:formylglycine-generating enzyme required for sulfatase activity
MLYLKTSAMQRPRSIILGVVMFLLTFNEHLQAQTPKELTNSIGMKLKLIPKGTFDMGSAANDPGADLDEPLHQVTLSRDFYIGQFEVTQSQYKDVLGTNPSQFPRDKKIDPANYPVEGVSWLDAVEFCQRLSELPEEKKAGRIYRLPTEAEWEYACRAGSPAAFCFGNDPQLLSKYAWFDKNGGGQTHPVGLKRPNDWGLYDMHGNAWEWVADWYEVYPRKSVTDPKGPRSGKDRVYRGASWNYSPDYHRSANRTATAPTFRGFEFLSISFRVAIDPPN